ncbi:Pdp3-interacting factor 1 [Penicillium angulare]|uniref:Pdp3-interacting factor 1 n=1 Tax=Penicillium angulare TaxID=116970 RepID=UPI00254232EE|nr:Pdp3-interacting factor 1 [Penicillium angulare]KAJ5291654.1 Pdp3-interacting factor 1 [Penicillium angulare]
MTNSNFKPAEQAPSQKRKIIIFSDFDGTICMQDTGHVLVDAHGCGAEARAKYEEEIKAGTRAFRDISDEMWGSLTIPFDDGFVVMEKSLDLDPGFKEFHQYCVANGFPFNVISAGLKPVLRRVLDNFLGEAEVTTYPSHPQFICLTKSYIKQTQSAKLTNPSSIQSSSIDIVANDATFNEDGTWKPIWRHDVDAGHDKALSVNEARTAAQAECLPNEMPLIIFIGDGISDLAAASEADVLFARRGLRLEQYCLEKGIKYTPFDSFSDIKKDIEKISAEDQKKTGGVGKPVRYNPRANLWRRISSKEAVPTLMAAATPSNEEKMFLWPETFSEPQARDAVPKTIDEGVEEPVGV